MSYALIDNATLSAVQRLMGEAPSRSRSSVDPDICALENYVQATIFYDKILAIDDYKAALRSSRAAAFPQVKFLSPEEFNLKPFEDEAQEISSAMRPEIRGGEFVDEDIKALIDTLKTHIICTWDVASSVYYLTLKVIAEVGGEEFDKYGKISAAIFSELSDAKSAGKYLHPEPVLIDRYGRPIKNGYRVPGAKWGPGETGGMTSGLKSFLASLVWLSNRTIYYSKVAKYLKADAFLYPIRQAYQQYYITKTSNYDINYTRNILDLLSRTASADIVNVASMETSVVGVKIPLFCAWLANRVGDPRRIIAEANDIRESPSATSVRNKLSEINNLVDERGFEDANVERLKLIEDIEKASKALREKYSLTTRQGIPLTSLIQVYNVSGGVFGLPKAPPLKIAVPKPKFLREWPLRKGVGAIYRDLAADLATVASLGEARTTLGSRVAIDDSSGSYNPKAENPIYRDAHSSFKSPM